ncbi:hypothetical protein CDAR_255731 [Caerostris darwini]|uniref:Uncharacterized protein n=1 Tax=Caerostris darwini TaxID=1538125 RepID=A0AAV4VD31_9ARAC|nr:hypothetical protein CDAR_255731 [Caerostris darwini]
MVHKIFILCRNDLIRSHAKNLFSEHHRPSCMASTISPLVIASLSSNNFLLHIGELAFHYACHEQPTNG